MVIRSRKAAKAAGVTTFSTGRLCKNGHASPRFTLNGECTECDAGRISVKKPKVPAYLKPKPRKLLSLLDAKIQGKRLYYTGERCDVGHYSERWVKSGKCVRCVEIFKELRSRIGRR